MRSIKFRAWDNVHGPLGDRMVYHGDTYNLKTLRDFWQWVGQHEPMPVMQSTGLRDRCGREIYEGDVVKTHWQYDGAFNQDYTVTGKVIFDPEVAQFLIFQDEEHVRPFHSLERDEYYPDQTEVIGNVYEHPHLLREAP